MISIIVTTYQPEGSMRAKYLRITIESLVKHLKGDEFRLIIADDGSPDQDMNFMLCRYVEKNGWSLPVITNANRSGVGGSINLAIQHVDGPWLLTTDDWMLEYDLDLDVPSKLLQWYDIVRVGAIHPNVLCTTRFNEKIGWWLELDQKGGGYVFGTRPFLAKDKLLGPFKEMCSAYEVETDYAERVRDSALRIAHIGILGGPFLHIGENQNSIGAKWP